MIIVSLGEFVGTETASRITSQVRPQTEDKTVKVTNTISGMKRIMRGLKELKGRIMASLAMSIAKYGILSQNV